SAMASFRRANAIYRAEPHGFIYLGTMFANAARLDSAASYFEQGIAIAARDAKYAEEQRDATFNLARIFQGLGKHDQAVSAYRSYLQMAPNDVEALAGLATLYAGAGKMDSARALYTQVLERADSLDSETLFRAGVGIFQGVPTAPDSAASTRRCRSEPPPSGTTPAPSPRRIAARCDSIAGAAMKAHRAASADVYRSAARAFEAGLAKNPYSRDGLFNLTNTYLALSDSAKMLPAAQRLYQVDPMSRTGLRLLAQAWNFRGTPDSTLHYLIAGDSLLALDVNVSSFLMREQEATLEGLATNFHTRSSRPLNLAVEFLDVKGEPVAAQTVAIPGLSPSGTHQFQSRAIGKGIVAWRYKKGT
ncbi:MAG: tetratricopeptide repeat protein, partial [Gemmatimonadales bacterium]